MTIRQWRILRDLGEVCWVKLCPNKQADFAVVCAKHKREGRSGLGEDNRVPTHR
jgi:hypothetical protein